MKKIIGVTFIIQCSIVLLISCDLKSKKEAEIRAEIEAEMIEKNRQEELRMAERMAKLAEQERQEKERIMERFVGKYYTWENGGIEVMSDGRVIKFDDWGKWNNYLGNIQIISNNAFLVDGEVPYVENTSKYKIINGVEEHFGYLGKNTWTGFVFDISENRAYVGKHFLDAKEKYQNKDITNPMYIKYRKI